MRSLRLFGLIATILLLCGGCAAQRTPAAAPLAPIATIAVDPADPSQKEDHIVSAKGYGVVAAQGAVSLDQAKLLAMRAAKVDAYRNLAERLQGLRVNSSSNAAAFASQGDAVQTSAEYFLRGARVVSIAPVRDGIYEAVVELDLDSPGASVTLTTPPAIPTPVAVEEPTTTAKKKNKSFSLFNLFGSNP